MNKKGFTLVELLAVIVILAVIALITVPQVLRLIEDAQKDALKDSAYGIIEAGNLFYAKNSLSLFEEKQERVNFEIINNRFANVKNAEQKLDFKGKMPKSGKFQINSNGGTAISICNGKYCACKSATETMVTVLNENCAIDGETGEIESNVPDGKLKELEEKITALEKTKVLPGTVISYMGNTVPKGYLACDGKTYNINDYPELSEQIKLEFGSYSYFGGDGTKTFAVPDLRGEFLRGTGTASRNTGSGEAVGIHQDPTKLPMVGTSNTNTNINAILNLNDTNSYAVDPDQKIKGSIKSSSVKTTWLGDQYENRDYRYTTRPTNTSVLYAIKY